MTQSSGTPNRPETLFDRIRRRSLIRQATYFNPMWLNCAGGEDRVLRELAANELQRLQSLSLKELRQRVET
jgi:hypothetical protein